jgi:hypothetical protein
VAQVALAFQITGQRNTHIETYPATPADKLWFRFFNKREIDFVKWMICQPSLVPCWDMFQLQAALSREIVADRFSLI